MDNKKYRQTTHLIKKVSTFHQFWTEWMFTPVYFKISCKCLQNSESISHQSYTVSTEQ